MRGMNVKSEGISFILCLFCRHGSDVVSTCSAVSVSKAQRSVVGMPMH